ncbi:MAG TPA: sigma-70 family RNA polymerase sigma factor [Thermoanaerobaculia bacterium]|jgi:RNA polymerase sigma-70 factor (ECF subfamily)
MLESARIQGGASRLADQEKSTAGLEDLVARVRAGDPRAEERIVELYGRGVAVILDRHTNGRPEAEDLFQDTFRLCLEKLRRGELREPAKLPGFLAQIARSLAIEHYRKLARRKTDADSDAILDAVASSESPLAGLLARENAALVRHVLQELANERDRQILLRFYIAEEDKDRISADYGLSSLQFNRVLHRARQRYKELLTERLGGDRVTPVVGAIILFLVTLWWREHLGGRA